MTDFEPPTEAALRSQLARAADNAQRRWVESVIANVDAAVRQVHAERGDALMLWIDPNGELQARRFCREQSVIREYLPQFLTKRGPR